MKLFATSESFYFKNIGNVCKLNRIPTQIFMTKFMYPNALNVLLQTFKFIQV